MHSAAGPALNPGRRFISAAGKNALHALHYCWMEVTTLAEKSKSALRETIEAIVIALVLALFIRTFIVQAFKIPSGSMIPTLLIGDHLLVNKFLYGVRNPLNGQVWIPLAKPRQGDIIVFKYPRDPSQDFIKRVVGVAGDKVEVKNKELFVNDAPYVVKGPIHSDPQIRPGLRDNFGPVIVPEHAVFVMGDNRDNSHDSRFWGCVDLTAIKGKAMILYWSWDSDASLAQSVRWNRIGDLIH